MRTLHYTHPKPSAAAAFHFYVSLIGNSLRKRASAVDKVREALSQQRINACYQPKFRLGTDIIVGFEAVPLCEPSRRETIPYEAATGTL